MKCNSYGFLFLICNLFLGVTSSFASEDQSKLQELHRDIGNNLITIRKEYTGAQSVIYTLLDQVGKLYAISKSSLEKKEKQDVFLEKTHGFACDLKKELENAKKEIVELKKTLAMSDKKLKESNAELAQLTKAQEVFSSQQETVAMAQGSADKEKEELLQEREALFREREILVRERDAAVQERNVLLQTNPVDELEDAERLVAKNKVCMGHKKKKRPKV